MATRHHLNTDHWSKMRMNILKTTINDEQRGRVLSWEKHQKIGVQRELEAGIRGARNLPEHKVGPVHNFQDVLTDELDEYVPGSAYFRRQERNLQHIDQNKKNRKTYGHPLMTGSQYTLVTPPTDPQSDQTRSRVPVFQCRGKI